jgi:ParB-like chromosome segregation protein Spo0J
MSARASGCRGHGMHALKITPRTHTKKQTQQIAASIKEFGFINPVLIDGVDGIVAGHGRVEAAKLLGMKDVPTVSVEHLTPAQIRAYVIADNKLAENAGWDRALLALELKELSVEMNFDIAVTGFERAEVDLLIQDSNASASDEADEVPEIDRRISIGFAPRRYLADWRSSPAVRQCLGSRQLRHASWCAEGGDDFHRPSF